MSLSWGSIVSEQTQKTVRLERGLKDHILPLDFFDVLVHRFLPVLSMTYIASIIGIAINKGDFVHYMFHDKGPYIRALLVVLWVSVPGLIWILMNGSPYLKHYADMWYKIVAVLMVLTISISFLLFPEANVYGLRLFFALSMPVFVIIYYFFIKGGLPAVAAYPLNMIGLSVLIYGAAINKFF